jgi:glucose 1-dehydrogenase/3-oxoacyl-[acyl-carrier protein] reductase
MRLQDKVALVTGARRGIGRAVALELARQGAHVAVNDVTGEEQARAVVDEIRGMERRAMIAMADVSDEAQVQSMVARVGQELGPIDILVNNAGIETIIPLLEMTEQQWTEVINVNLKGEWLCAREVVRQMIQRGRRGAIVNIASIQAGMALPGRTHYAPSKRGVEALTRNLAAELAEHGIRVNCINPGLVATDMTRWVMDDPNILPVVLDKIPLKRAGRPEEIATVAAFLASDDASYMTGQCIYVDGGWIVT